MNETVLTTIAITGFGIAFFHAAIPTHWLPFVLTARAQHWNHARTLGITALAATGHVLFTAALGLIIAWFGIALNAKVGDWFPRIAGGALLLLGAFYVLRHFTGKGRPHTHFVGGHPHAQEHKQDQEQEQGPGAECTQQVPDRVAIASLLAMLTFSPCEAFLPIYASGVRYGWIGFALLTAILSIGTVAGMVVFTGLTLAGVRKIKLGLLEKYEGGLMGALLCLAGLLVILFET